jgi:hypothetical protein
MQNHELRVVNEKIELDEKINNLGKFIDDSPIFPVLPAEERERLVRQKSCMTEYSDILKERIDAFPK